MKPILFIVFVLLVGCQGDHHGDDHRHNEMGDHMRESSETDHRHGEGDESHTHGEETHSHGDQNEDHSHMGDDADSHDNDDADHRHGSDDDNHAHGEDTHTHDNDASHAHGEDSHSHGPEGPSETVTLYTDTAQLFVEFPVLVKDQESPFAAHLTRLRDHVPVDRGQVVVELRGNNLPVERFSVDKPTQAGIFRVTVTPQQTGQRRVHLRVSGTQINAAFDMGTYMVFANQDQAKASAKDQVQDAISFLLEQQWTMPFRVQQATAKAIRPNVPAHGQLKTPHDAETTIVAPADGRLKAVAGRFPAAGMQVKRGEPLLALAVVPSQDDVDPATLSNDLEAAEIAVEKAQRDYDRQAELVERGIAERRALDDANSELKDAKADLRAAQARLNLFAQNESLDNNNQAIRLPSPIDGVVAEVFPAPSALVERGEPLVRVVKRDQLWLDVAIPAHYASLVKNVSGAWFQLPKMPGVFELDADQLLAVAPEIDTASRTLNVRFAIENVRGDLFAGMTTQVHVIVDEPTLTTAIPYDALVEDDGRDVVYVQRGGESFVKRVVRLGVRDGAWIEILEGVAAGEWVVSQGAYSVKLAASSTGEIGHGHSH